MSDFGRIARLTEMLGRQVLRAEAAEDARGRLELRVAELEDELGRRRAQIEELEKLTNKGAT